MNKNKLIELRCKAWGITEDEYYCNQCSDFSLEDMARAYRRGKNKGRADLEKENAELDCQKNRNKACYSCANATERCFRNEIACPCQKYKSYKEENAELRKVAEFQQSSNMSRYFENKKLKEVLTVGSTWNKGLNSRNKYLEEQNDKYRNMMFDKMEQLDKAKEIIRDLCNLVTFLNGEDNVKELKVIEAEQFLKECEK